MGIKGLLKNLNQEEPDVKSRKYDYVYIDCNYMLHYLIYNCKNDLDLHKKIYTYFDYFFQIVTVKIKIFLIFDGEHPEKQTNPEANPKLQTLISRYKYKTASTAYDKQNIAPKTPIVKKFKNNILDILNIYKKLYKSTYTIEVSDDYEDDEADFKILSSIYDNDYNNICIVSKDSDMVLISYSLACNKNISIDIMSNLRPILFIDINKLTKTYDYDYILVILLLGNDYLPKLSNIDYNTIIRNYNQYNLHQNPKIIINKRIVLDNLINYISYIIVNKNIKLNIKNFDFDRFKKYYNNILWCLKKYKVINDETNYVYQYIEDNNKVINIYNFIYSL